MVVSRTQKLCWLAGTALTATAMAQGPQWVVLSPGAAPGARPTIRMNDALSDAQQTVLDIAIPGFYVETVVQPGVGTFKKISLPGESSEASLRQVGRPALPALSFLLGIPTDAPGVVVSSCTIDPVNVPGFERVLPTQPDVEEVPGPTSPPIPPFEFDRSFYLTNNVYPTHNGGAAGDAGNMSGVRVQGANALPFKVNSATGVMECARGMQITFSHPGLPRPPIETTIRQAELLGGCMPNVGPDLVLTNELEYEGRYLIVCAPSLIQYAEEFADLKRDKGYEVAFRTPANVPGGVFTPTNVRQAIKDWYNGFSEQADCYVLLLGDIGTVPEIRDPVYNSVSDHYYACIDDDDMYADVAIGRLSYNSTADAVNQFDKIMDYTNTPPSDDAWFTSALAVGHREVDAEFSEVLAEAVDNNADDLFPLNFVEIYGTTIPGFEHICWDELSEQPHLVFYRGHGSTRTWSTWDFNGQSQDADDLDFPNYAPTDSERPCIMINSACGNGAFHGDDSWTEEWQSTTVGSVANYGATASSRRWANHAWTRWYFFLMQNQTSPTLSSVCTLGQYLAAAQYAQAGSDISDKNVWQYALMGDPDMTVWHNAPVDTNNVVPPSINIGLTTLPVYVETSAGQPAAAAVVAATTADGTVRETAYTDASGIATLTINAEATGTLIVQSWDFRGTILPQRSEIIIKCPADVDGDDDVDSDDIVRFFREWEAGEADVDGDDDTDSDDVIAYFARWDAGC